MSLFVNRNETTAWRLLFAAAAIYNLVFAVWSGLFPAEFFALLDTEPPDHWRAVAVVVGSFAVCYAFAVWQPERASIAVGLGLASKVLGPLAWFLAVTLGDSTPRLFPLLVIGDLAWWLPFVIYLTRHRCSGLTAAAGWCFAIHLLANLLLLRAASGTEIVADTAARQRFVLDHVSLWTATWLLWSLASTSLFGLCVAWAQKLPPSRAAVLAAVLVIGVGVAFDLRGETILVVEATRSDLTAAEFAATVRHYQWLSPAIANGLYCLGGIVLSVLSWRTGMLRGAVGALGMAVWLVGLGLTTAAIVEYRLGMIVCGGGVMILFLPWSLAMAWRLQQATHSK